jgi:hypothetical protein
VQPADTYSAARGFGWSAAPRGGFDRGALSGTTQSSLLRDGHYGASGASGARTFRADLPAPGDYEITVTIGDNSSPAGPMQIVVPTSVGIIRSGREDIADVSTAAGQFTHRTFVVSTSVPQIQLVFSAPGSGNVRWVVNAIAIRQIVEPLSIVAHPGAKPADGVNRDTFVVMGAAGGSLLTISSSLGLVAVAGDADPFTAGVQADADSRYTGLQVRSDGVNPIHFTIRRPAAAGTADIRVSEFSGASRGAYSQTYFAVAPLAAQLLDTTTATVASAALSDEIMAASVQEEEVDRNAELFDAPGKVIAGERADDIFAGWGGIGLATFQAGLSARPIASNLAAASLEPTTAPHEKPTATIPDAPHAPRLGASIKRMAPHDPHAAHDEIFGRLDDLFMP